MEQSLAVFKSLYQEDLYKIPSSVVVIINTSWDDLSDDEKILLAKILSSVRLTPASVQILVKQQFTLQTLQNFSPAQIIVFGATFNGAQQKYELIQMENTAIILADELQKLDDVKKKNLWIALKQMFGLAIS